MIEPPAVVTAEDWERCSPWIAAALLYSGGTHELADVLADIEANRATFWPFERSALVTQMIDFPRLRQFNFWLAGGEMADLLSHEADLVEWAAAHGCSRVAVPGRPGWRRVMAPFGYSPLCEFVSKEIAAS